MRENEKKKRKGERHQMVMLLVLNLLWEDDEIFSILQAVSPYTQCRQPIAIFIKMYWLVAYPISTILDFYS